jgi:hypothetical protein
MPKRPAAASTRSPPEFVATALVEKLELDGFVDTPSSQCRIPTGRLANSEEIAKAVYFLSFAAAS